MALNWGNAAQGGLTGFASGAATGQPHMAGIFGAGGFLSGLFSGSSSSSGDLGPGKKAKKAARAMQKIDNDQMFLKYAMAQQLRNANPGIYDHNAKVALAEASRAFDYANQQRTELYNKSVELYKDSVNAFDETVNLNDIAATMAMNDAARLRNQRVTELNNNVEIIKHQFKNNKIVNKLAAKGLNRQERQAIKQTNMSIKDILLQSGIQTDLSILDKGDIDEQIANTRNMAYFDKAQLTDNIAEAAEMLGYSKSEVKRIVDEAKDLASLNISSINNTMASQLEAAKYNQTGINNKLKTALRDGKQANATAKQEFKYTTDVASENLKAQEKQLKADEYQLDSEMTDLKGRKRELVDSAAQAIKDIEANKDFQDKQIQSKLRQAKLENNFARQELSLAQDERYAEAAIKTDEMRRQGLMEQSAQIAKGQSGRSARKSVQGLAFSNQQAQALIAKSIVRADAKYVIDREKLVQGIKETRRAALDQLEYNRTVAESAFEKQGIGLERAASNYEASKKTFQAKKELMSLKKNQAQIDKLAVGKNKRLTEDTIRDTNEQYTDLVRDSELSLEAAADELKFTRANQRNQKASIRTKYESQKEAATTEINKLNTQNKFFNKGAGRKISQIQSQKSSSIKRLNNQQKKINRTLTGVLDRGALNVNELSTNLMFSQFDIQDRIKRNALELGDLEFQTAMSLNSLGTAHQSAKDQYQLSKERIRWDQYLSDRSAESVLLDEPEIPDMIPPVQEAPGFVQGYIEEPDFKALLEAQSKAIKSKSYYNPNTAASNQAFLGALGESFNMATSIMSFFQGPPDFKKPEQRNPFAGGATFSQAANMDFDFLGNNNQFKVAAPNAFNQPLDLSGFSDQRISNVVMDALPDMQFDTIY